MNGARFVVHDGGEQSNHRGMTATPEWACWMKSDGTPRHAFGQDELSTCKISRGWRTANVTASAPDFKGKPSIALGQLIKVVDRVGAFIVDHAVRWIIQQAAPPEFRDHVETIATGPTCYEHSSAVTVA